MKKIYTRQDIAKMNTQEFQENEKDIMEQLSQGKIKNVDYFAYTNPISGNRGIYTRERIKNMSTEKYNKCEQEIMAQMKQIGIPSEKEVGVKKYTTGDRPDIIVDDNRADYEIVCYEWIALDDAHTCDECASLNGTIYSTEDEIPEEPHYGCRCLIYARYY